MKPTSLLFMPLTKVDVEQRLVYGVGAAEVADRAGEIMDYATSKDRIAKWSENAHTTSLGKSYGNIRRMHKAEAVGKVAAPIGFNDELKRVELCVKVTDDATWKDVTEGVLTGFSIGGSYYLGKRWPDADNPKLQRYTADPSEFSLVDLPCIPGSTFTMVKAAGVEEQVLFKAVAERKDVNPKAGLKQYGNVKFADEQNKKYPLDSAAHVRAAASYWGMPKNRAKYSHKDQMLISGRIAAAEREYGIGSTAEKALELFGEILTKLDQLLANASLKKGAGADKTKDLAAAREELGAAFVKVQAAKEAGTRLAKGMWGVSQLAQAIAAVDCCTRDAEYEAASEGDESEVPAMLAEARSKLSECLVHMVQEETDELQPEEDAVEKLQKMLAELAELMKSLPAAELTKAVSGKNMEHVQAIHDKTVELGAKHNGTHDEELEGDGYSKPGEGGEVAEKVATAIKKAVDAATAPLVERLAKMEAEPAPAGGPRSLSADALLKAGAPVQVFKPVGMGVGGGEEALKATHVLDLVKAAQAAAIPQEGGQFKLAPGKGNLAKLAA